jgi:hypothetical protein
MNLSMFPKMVTSHDEGWAWLMQVHPSVLRMYAFYVVPMSLIPPAMLLYAVNAYGDRMMYNNITMDQAWMLAAVFFVAELVMVSLVAAVIQRLGAVVEARPAFHDAFAFAAVVPTPLWLSSLVLFVPNLTIIALVTAAALCVAAIMIYEGNYRVFGLDDDGKSYLLAASILAAGLVAWVCLMGMTFVVWGIAVS